MVYLKRVLAGIVTGAAGAVLWTVIELLVLTMRSADAGLGASSVALPADLILPFSIGFAVGFFVIMRRQKRRAAAAG
jgi:hypothetical protein